MQKFMSSTALLAAGMMLSGLAQAQQTPAATPKTTTSAKTTTATSAKKSTTATAHKTPATPLTLKTDKEKASYALGMSVGKQLHAQGAEIDTTLLLRGLKDALADAKPMLTDEEARTAVMNFQKQTRDGLVAKNKNEGDAYRATNKTKPGVVTLPSGLQYKVLQHGNGPKPTAEDSVVCNYKGTFINGKEFDSSYKRGEPATFPVTGVIKGWTEALQMMPVGSKWQLVIPPDLAYGENGRPSIPPNATLVFEVELVKIEEKPKAEAPAAEAKPQDPGTAQPQKPAQAQDPQR